MPRMRPTSLIARALALAAASGLLAACGGGGEEPAAAEATPAGADEGSRAKALAHVLPPLGPAPAGLTGNVVCNNLDLGAITVDNVEVPSGMACRLSGTTVRGSVQVAPQGIVLANAVNVAGSVQGSQALHVEVIGARSRVAGDIQLEGGGSGTFSDAQVAGNLFVNGVSDAVTIRGTRVGGNVQFTDNLGGGEISGNRITGNLQCTGNVPAPLASRNTAALIEGQCRSGGGGGGGTPPPLSGNVTCVNLTIGAIRLDSVIVPAGSSCTLLGTTLNGSIELAASSRLIAENVNVTGNVISEGASSMSITGTSRVGGSVQVQRGAGAALAGMAITGNLQIDAMTGTVSASGNRITGNLQAVGNRGGLTFTGNTMGGVMQCTENFPAPTGSGNVATLKEDQCLGL
jgi:hypothetical protein